MTSYIYESPDQGKTVYRRLPGETKKILVYAQDNPFHERGVLWDKIVQQSIDDPILVDLMQKVEIYYKLKYGSD